MKFICDGMKTWELVQQEGIKIKSWTTEFSQAFILECEDFDYTFLKLKYGEKIWPETT